MSRTKANGSPNQGSMVMTAQMPELISSTATPDIVPIITAKKQMMERPTMAANMYARTRSARLSVMGPESLTLSE